MSKIRSNEEFDEDMELTAHDIAHIQDINLKKILEDLKKAAEISEHEVESKFVDRVKPRVRLV